MKNILLHIVLFLITLVGYSQPLPTWNYDRTEDSARVKFIEDAIILDGKKLVMSDSDAVAIFVENKSRVYESAGYAYYNSAFDTVGLNVFLDSAASAPPYKMFFWSNLKKCQIEVRDTTNFILVPSGYSSVSKASGNSEIVQYSKDVFNTSEFKGSVNKSPNINVSFSCADTSLKFDSKTGEIIPYKSKPGVYTMEFKSDFCLRNTQQVITIKRVSDSIPDIDSLIFDKLPATCDKEGSIFIKPSSIKGNEPFTYKLENQSDNSLLSNTSGVFEEVKQGNYSLSITDSIGGTSVYPSLLSIDKVGDCQNTVLRPDGKDGIQSLYIPEAGQAKILNRSGDLIKQLSIPGEWNCQDNHGNQVPMGDYYLFINEIQSKVITVLR